MTTRWWDVELFVVLLLEKQWKRKLIKLNGMKKLVLNKVVNCWGEIEMILLHNCDLEGYKILINSVIAVILWIILDECMAIFIADLILIEIWKDFSGILKRFDFGYYNIRAKDIKTKVEKAKYFRSKAQRVEKMNVRKQPHVRTAEI